jgi:hypothetical protein
MKAPDPADKGADQFQPVNRRAGYGTDRLARLLDYLDRWPAATLASGEGKLLADEIHRLKGTND